jgi:hypothetical protein
MALSPALRRATLAAGALATAGAAARAARSPHAQLGRMSGSSIAAPDAAGWITDFLNAAYFARPEEERAVDDLRLAFGIVTTHWHRRQRRLRGPDVLPFHRAFGRERFLDASRSRRGTLDREALVAGARRLHGAWFLEAWADPARRGWGIAFESAADRAAHRPEDRLAHAPLGPPTPPRRPPAEQTWHTYPPVPVASADRVVQALVRPETWPDYASELGRFTPVRAGGLAGQTFEIEVVARLAPRVPAYTRGYVTVTRLVTPDDGAALAGYVEELNEAMARLGRDEPQPVPAGATAVVAFDLTTHEGHFMGRARNRLLLYEREGQAYLRAAGTWDEMPWHLDQAYRRLGSQAQHAFWGMGRPQESMLHQIALAVA